MIFNGNTVPRTDEENDDQRAAHASKGRSIFYWFCAAVAVIVGISFSLMTDHVLMFVMTMLVCAELSMVSYSNYRSKRFVTLVQVDADEEKS